MMAYVEKESIVYKIYLILAITTVVRAKATFISTGSTDAMHWSTLSVSLPGSYGQITEVAWNMTWNITANQSTTVWPHTQPILKGKHQENCPDIQTPYGSNSTCVLSDHCRKATCTSQSLNRTGPLGYMVLTVQLYGCCQAVRAKVTLDSDKTRKNWWYTFGDGEKARLPMVAMLHPQVFGKKYLKVDLNKNGSKVHFKLNILVYKTEFATLIEGDLRAPKCVEEGRNEVSFLPQFDIPSKCVYSLHCSKLECVAGPTVASDIRITVRFEAIRCKHSLAGKVVIQLPGLDWSDTIEDREKARLPVTRDTMNGTLPISDKTRLFVKVRLQETKGNFANYTVLIVGYLTYEIRQLNLVVLQGRQPISSAVCGSWFSRQSIGVKAAVIVVPILIIVISLAAFCCYKRRRDGACFMVDIFPGRNKHEMQRQYGEL